MSGGSYVLVGYDGTKESEPALRQATGEARLRRLPLTIVHAWRRPYAIGAFVDVGDRGTRDVKPILLGATSGALLQHVPCTVAIVQPAYGAS